MNFPEELANRIQWTEGVVKSFLPEETGNQKEIMEENGFAHC